LRTCDHLLTIRFSNVLLISGVMHHAKTTCMKWLAVLFKTNKLFLEGNKVLVYTTWEWFNDSTSNWAYVIRNGCFVAQRQQMAMICGQKTNFPCCVAQQMAIICGQKTNFPSCVARQRAVICGKNGLFITNLTFFVCKNKM